MVIDYAQLFQGRVAPPEAVRSMSTDSLTRGSKEQNRGKKRPHDNRPQKRPIVLVHQFADLTIAEVKAQNKNQVP